MKLVCSGRTPNSPAAPTAVTCSTAPSKSTPVGVTSLNWNISAIARCRRLTRFAACEALGLGASVVDRADEVEGLLGQVVALAVEDFFEAAHGLGPRHVGARDVGERLRDVHRLRQETLDAACARDRQLVVGRKLVHAENRDDVLEVLIALQNLLNPSRDVVMI